MADALDCADDIVVLSSSKNHMQLKHVKSDAVNMVFLSFKSTTLHVKPAKSKKQ
jgi:hypothetical protein